MVISCVLTFGLNSSLAVWMSNLFPSFSLKRIKVETFDQNRLCCALNNTLGIQFLNWKMCIRINSVHTAVFSPRSQCHSTSDSSPSSRCQPAGSAETLQSQSDDTCQHTPPEKNGPDPAWRQERLLSQKSRQTHTENYRFRLKKAWRRRWECITLLFLVTLSSAVCHLCSLHRCSQTAGRSSCLSRLPAALTPAKALHLCKKMRTTKWWLNEEDKCITMSCNKIYPSDFTDHRAQDRDGRAETIVW